MEKIKIEQRVENAFNAFFDDGNLVENNFLTNSVETNLAQENTAEIFAKKADVFLKILKQIFLFFPGTFVLYNLVLLFTILSVNPPAESPALRYPDRLAITLLVSAFMTIFGLGNIRNLKHFIIPTSIVLFAFVAGVAFSFLPNVLRNVDTCAMYLLPGALIIPILARNWIDKRDKDPGV